MPKEQRTFTKEFKLEAVQLVQRSGKSQSQVARELGIADSTLHHWWVLRLEMVDKSISPLQTHFKPVFGDLAVQIGLLFPE